MELCGVEARRVPQTGSATGLPTLSATSGHAPRLVWGTKGRRFESGRPDWNAG